MMTAEATVGNVTVTMSSDITTALAQAIHARGLSASQFASASASVKTSVVVDAILAAYTVSQPAPAPVRAANDKVELPDGSVWEIDRATGTRIRISDTRG